MCVLQWAVQASEGQRRAEEGSQEARRKAWKEWVEKADKGGKFKLGTWVKEETQEPIASVIRGEGEVVLDPNNVAQAFAEDWGSLWESGSSCDAEVEQFLEDLGSEEGVEMPRLEAEHLMEAAGAMSNREAAGVDAWMG